MTTEVIVTSPKNNTYLVDVRQMPTAGVADAEPYVSYVLSPGESVSIWVYSRASLDVREGALAPTETSSAQTG